MSSEEKVVARGRQKKKEASLELVTPPLKKKRGRKPRSPSPPPPPPSPGPLSFFKVLIGDFKDALFIPPMAACTLKGLAKKYVYIEDADGKYWNVKMSMVDGSLAFRNGWHDFVSDHSMTVGEFVLFTYTGGLLFTARIFGTSALERVDFQVKRRKGRCAKDRCTTELKPVNVRIPKKLKTAQVSEEKHSPSGNEVLRSLKWKKKTTKCDFPKVHVIESDSISEGVLELSSAGEKPLYESNTKESENALHNSEQAWHRNSDATVRELNVISPELANSDMDNIETAASKSIRNKMSTTEKGAALLHSGGALLSKQTAEEPDAMTKTATWVIKAHSDIKEGSAAEMSGSQVPMIKVHDEIRNNGKIEQEHSHDLEMLDSEPHYDRMASLSNLEHAECSPELEFNLIKSERISEKVFLSGDGICYTNIDEKLTELATGASFNKNGQEEPLCQNDHATLGSETNVPCETISAVSSSLILDCTKDKKETIMSIGEEYGVPETKGSSAIAESGLQSSIKVYECKCKNYPEIVKGNDWQSGIAHDTFFDEDEKNVTPCSSRSRVEIDRTDSVEIPSSSCISFSVCLSDDIQSSLELQKKLACQIGKLKHERKVVVLQDLCMRCWPVLYHQSFNFVGFIGGWVDFARANNICRGDICEFELVNKTELKFRVHIMKAEGSIFDEKVT